MSIVRLPPRGEDEYSKSGRWEDKSLLLRVMGYRYSLKGENPLYLHQFTKDAAWFSDTRQND